MTSRLGLGLFDADLVTDSGVGMEMTRVDALLAASSVSGLVNGGLASGVGAAFAGRLDVRVVR